MTVSIGDIASLLTAFAAVGAFIVSLRTNRRVTKTDAKVEEVRHATNSLTDRLVATTRTEAHAAGVKEEQDKRD